MTWALTLAGRFRPLLLVPYWLAQLSGGFVGALLVRVGAGWAVEVRGPQAVTKLDEYNSIMGGATVLAPQDDWHQGLVLEAVLTLLLALTVLMCAADAAEGEPERVLAPLAVGLAVSLGVFGG